MLKLINNTNIMSATNGDIVEIVDKKYKFFHNFNKKSGEYFRSDVYTTKNDPFMASYPTLIDIGIMGHCVHGKSGLCKKGGVECYQNGLFVSKSNMSFDNFKKIIDESSGKTFQVALGGRGDPNKHEEFEKFLKYCTEKHIVPNYTTSGFLLTDEEVEITKKYVGAVAVSWYRQNQTTTAIQKFLNKNIKTNIHYVLGNSTIDEALNRLENNDFPDGINAVVFLTHKNVGMGSISNVLSPIDPKVKRFFSLLDTNNFKFKIGMDSCMVPGVINFSSKIAKESIDTCEAAKYSAYISADMKMVPCSFDQSGKWGVDIEKNTIQNAWDSIQFSSFRNSFLKRCKGCSNKKDCGGGCPILPEIVLCNKKDF